MTLFFVPGAPNGAQADQAYEDMRHDAEVDAGRPPRARRIYGLDCRRGGRDCEARVGEQVGFGATVHAIFDVGDRYVVYVPGGSESVPKKSTYSVVEFD